MPNKYSQKHQNVIVAGVTFADPRANSGARLFGIQEVTSKALNLQEVTCTAIASGDVIILSTQTYSRLETSNVRAFCVTSIMPGSGFYIGPTNSVAAMVSSFAIHWAVFKNAT